MRNALSLFNYVGLGVRVAKRMAKLLIKDDNGKDNWIDVGTKTKSIGSSNSKLLVSVIGVTHPMMT